MVGELFRTNTKRNERTELVVLITPRVVGSASDAEIVTRELREKCAASASPSTQPPPVLRPVTNEAVAPTA